MDKETWQEFAKSMMQSNQDAIIELKSRVKIIEDFLDMAAIKKMVADK